MDNNIFINNLSSEIMTDSVKKDLKNFNYLQDSKILKCGRLY